MIPITNITGRLGNQMFEFAALYSFTKDLGIDYYCQDVKYFEKYEREIRAIFSQGNVEPIDRIAIHVRRGDYVNNPFYVDLTKTNYYVSSTRLFPNDTFRVFSDDIAWCKKYFKDDRYEFSEKTELEDLNDMIACKGHIIANSSFSWWGAYLSPLYPYNPVVAPKSWYTDGVERTILPKHWNKI